MFLQVRWPNQQCQSTEGGWLVIQIALNLTRLISPCYNMHAHTRQWHTKKSMGCACYKQMQDMFQSLPLTALRLWVVITPQTLWWEIRGWSKSWNKESDAVCDMNWLDCFNVLVKFHCCEKDDVTNHVDQLLEFCIECDRWQILGFEGLSLIVQQISLSSLAAVGTAHAQLVFVLVLRKLMINWSKWTCVMNFFEW